MSILFATTVTNAKPQAKDYKLSDGGGLYLLVRPNGAKLWRLNYRYLEKGRTLAFGAWPAVGLADARARSDEARRLLAAGIDPSHQQKVDAARARVEENDTFKTVATEWVAKNEREGMAEITLSKIHWLQPAGREDHRTGGADCPARGRGDRPLRKRTADAQRAEPRIPLCDCDDTG